MTDDRVYTYLDAGGPLVALDARIGELVRAYELGGRFDAKVAGNRSDVNLVNHEGLLVQTAGNTAYVLDTETGALKWKHAEPEGRFVDYPTVAAPTGQVFVTTGLTPRDTACSAAGAGGPTRSTPPRASCAGASWPRRMLRPVPG